MKRMIYIGMLLSLNNLMAQETEIVEKSIQERVKVLGIREMTEVRVRGSDTIELRINRFDARGNCVEKVKKDRIRITRNIYAYDESGREILRRNYLSSDSSKAGSEMRTFYPDTATTIRKYYDKFQNLEEVSEERREYPKDTIQTFKIRHNGLGVVLDRYIVKYYPINDSVHLRTLTKPGVAVTYVITRKDEQGNTTYESGRYIHRNDSSKENEQVHEDYRFDHKTSMWRTYNIQNQLIGAGNQGITSCHYFYDSKGNLNKVEYYKLIQGVKKQLPGRIVEISYMSNGLPKEWIEYNPGNPAAKDITRYSFH